jgi:hypothetical protein
MRGRKQKSGHYKWLIFGIAVLLAPVSAGAVVDINTCSLSAMAGDSHFPCPAPGYNPTPPGFTPVSLIGSGVSFYGARSNPGLAPTPVDAWGYCRYVDNGTSATAYFVPFGTQPEWLNFITFKPATVTLSTCSRPADETLFPNPSAVDPNPQTIDVGLCTAPTPGSQTAHLTYARTSSSQAVMSVIFNCTVKGLCNADGSCGADQTNITRTVTGTYNPGVASDGDFSLSGWSWAHVAYSPLIPNPAPAIITVSAGGDGGGDGGGGDGGGGGGGGGGDGGL